MDLKDKICNVLKRIGVIRDVYITVQGCNITNRRFGLGVVLQTWLVSDFVLCTMDGPLLAIDANAS